MPVFFTVLPLFILCIGVISVFGTFFWIWMVVDCVMNKKISDTQKALWVLLIVFTHFIGALIYFCVGRSMRAKSTQYTQPRAAYRGYEAPQEAAYRGYEQGYQAPPPNNDLPQAYRESQHEPHQQVEHDYEQPQAMYPQDQHEE